MKLEIRCHVAFSCLMALAVLWPGWARAASPSVKQALRLAPIQRGVNYTLPAADKIDKCRIYAKKTDGHVGWVVEGPDGLTLRKFVDTNGDNEVDRWSYYKNGLEVYRDIDADFNRRADQYRWFHTGGTRWGLDKDEDGGIDTWKRISAEEVSAEVVAALATASSQRFTRLVLSARELKSLGLGKAKVARLEKKVEGLAKKFTQLTARQKTVAADAKWVQFSGSTPGVIPAGTDESTKDLQVYENVVAIVETGGKHSQVLIGTLVRVDEAWRVIDLPRVIASGRADTADAGFFFQASITHGNEPATARPDEGAQRLLAQLEKLDKAAERAATPKEQAEFNGRRAELLEEIARQAKSRQDRTMWLRQLADMLSAAVQSGKYPEGVKRLKSLFEKLQKNKADKDLAAYVRFRQLTAEYGLSLQAASPDFAKIQTDWLKNLQQYVKDYPTSQDAAEAMLQLAIAKEFAGKEDEAKSWYGRVVKGFSKSPAAIKATGARTRLESVGKSITFSGKSVTGGKIDLASYRGKVVLIQYWATWCEPAKADMETLKGLVKKYPRSFCVIGVSLDGSRKALTGFLTENPLPWPQVFEQGGLDSQPANRLGILTLPTMILVDKDGKVVNRNIQTTELAGALKKLMR